MKIVNIIGGIGNQMFQYAFALSLKKRFPEEDVLLDLSHFKGYNLHNGFEIERVFGCKLPSASKRQLMKVSYYSPNYKVSRIIRKVFGYRKSEFKEPRLFTYWGDKIDKITGDCYFEGSWQNEQYFASCKDLIRGSFVFKNPLSKQNISLREEIHNCQSVGIHVRRGDYLLEDCYKNICDLPYYQKAIRYILSKYNNAVFYIFSNDPDWCEKNIQPLCSDSKIISHNQGAESWADMMLMSECKHCIIAHSSFSWWAAWLNQNDGKVIVSPKGWFNREDITDSPQLKDWVLFDNE